MRVLLGMEISFRPLQKDVVSSIAHVAIGSRATQYGAGGYQPQRRTYGGKKLG